MLKSAIKLIWDTLKSSPLSSAVAFSILPQYLVVSFLASHRDLVEVYYSKGVYPYISIVLRFLFGWLPFSFGDILYSALVLLAFIWLYLYGKTIYRNTWKFLIKLLTVLSVFYFFFHFLWGLNYYREPLYKTLQIGHSYSTEELEAFTEKILIKANQVHRKINSNDSLSVEVPYTKREIFAKVSQGYESLGLTFPELRYHFRSLKKSIYSRALTYMGYSGYLNPFSGEANVNGRIPKFHFPVVSCHEVAHQLGYSAEDEANFIAYLAAVSSQDIYFKYAAYTFALQYAVYELKKRDFDKFKAIYYRINKGILENYKDKSKFWEAYENPIEPILKKTYNIYLKANSQTKGIKSYNYVTALLVNYYKDKSL